MDDEIEFAFEITKADYAEGTALISHKLKSRRSWVVPLLGIALIAVPFLQVDADGYTKPDPLLMWLLVSFGLIVIYYGVRYQSARYVSAQYYPATGIEHRPFSAIISAQKIRVRGTFSEWIYDWHAVLAAGESEKLFVLYTGLQIFVFAKRYLSNEQIIALQKFLSAQTAFAGGTTPKY